MLVAFMTACLLACFHIYLVVVSFLQFWKNDSTEKEQFNILFLFYVLNCVLRQKKKHIKKNSSSDRLVSRLSTCIFVFVVLDAVCGLNEAYDLTLQSVNHCLRLTSTRKY